jgi:hypothetical protein
VSRVGPNISIAPRANELGQAKASLAARVAGVLAQRRDRSRASDAGLIGGNVGDFCWIAHQGRPRASRAFYSCYKGFGSLA